LTAGNTSDLKLGIEANRQKCHTGAEDRQIDRVERQTGRRRVVGR